MSVSERESKSVEWFGHLWWICLLIGGEQLVEALVKDSPESVRHLYVGAVLVVVSPVFLYVYRQLPETQARLNIARERRKAKKAPVLSPTRKGSAELLLQEPRAEAAVQSGEQTVLTVLADYGRIADQTSLGHQMTKSIIAQGNVAHALLANEATWREHGKLIKEGLPLLESAVRNFEMSVDQMIECWSGYVFDTKRRDKRGPRFRGWLEHCAFRMPRNADSIARFKEQILSSTKGFNEYSDQALNDFGNVLDRFGGSYRRLGRGAQEALVVLDKTAAWPERIRWKLWRRKQARELTPPSLVQPHQPAQQDPESTK